MSTAPIREAPPLLRKDKRVAGGKSPVKTAWAKEGSSKSLIPAVGGKYSVSATPPPTSTTTATASPSPTKPAPSKPLIPAETASPAQMSPPKHQIMSPAKPKKDLVGPPPQTPSPSAPTPPVATPAAADPSKPIPDTLPSSPSLAPDGRRAVNDTPDFETPLGIFGPQLQQRETEDLCFAMGMTTPEVQKLVAIFNDIDLNCSGLINLRELYFLLDTPQNKYTSSILRFSTHQSDPVKLDIDDFVRIVCTFALMSQTDIYRFCFETFDEDDSGSLSKDEFVVMCDSIQIKGDGFFQGNFKKAMEAFDANHDGLLDFAEFIEMNRKFPLVFWPLFHFQETMQEKTLGKRMWTKIRARQLQIDAWRHYMKRFLGRAPPPTWKERWCGCISTDQRLRLIAAQLYDQDQLHLKMQTKSHPGGKRTEPDRKMLQRGTSKGEASSRNTKHSALPTTSSTSTTGSRTNHVGNPTHK